MLSSSARATGGAFPHAVRVPTSLPLDPEMRGPGRGHRHLTRGSRAHALLRILYNVADRRHPLRSIEVQGRSLGIMDVTGESDRRQLYARMQTGLSHVLSMVVNDDRVETDTQHRTGPQAARPQRAHYRTWAWCSVFDPGRPQAFAPIEHTVDENSTSHVRAGRVPRRSAHNVRGNGISGRERPEKKTRTVADVRRLGDGRAHVGSLEKRKRGKLFGS
ncbi:hypothetical protein BD414DRAFT_64019 [Trametes punicea]|nr:hypothetical protein BD414DRAFT_64019 [Trametes punicea]